MLWPVRKEIELAIHIKGGWRLFPRRATIVVRFKEASIGDLLEFQPDNVGDWAFQFVVSRCRKLKDWESRALYSDKYRVFDLIAQGYFGKNEENEKQGEWAPFSSTLEIICGKYNLTPNELLKEYTLAQFRALTEGIVWNMNAQTKEGQARNKGIASKHKIQSLGEDELKKRFDQLDAVIKARKK